MTAKDNKKVTIFHSNDEGTNGLKETIRYWSNACGELFRDGNELITKEELPLPLQRAYDDLWSDAYGCHCYLVETANGYGVALVNEYDFTMAEDAGVTMEELFKVACKDAVKVSEDSAFKEAKVFVGEFSGFEDCHELIVVFPADTPIEAFKNAARVLDRLL